MNRRSTAGFVPPSVYMRFRLFVLLGGRSSVVSSMPWGVRRSLVALATCSARPSPAAPPCAPTRPARCMFPDMPCMKRVNRDKKGDGPLVSSQEQRAIVVPRLNRLSTACQPMILFPHSVYM